MPAEECARLTGVISHIVHVAGDVRAEIATDGATDLVYEIRLPYEDGNASRFRVGDRVAILVNRTL